MPAQKPDSRTLERDVMAVVRIKGRFASDKPGREKRVSPRLAELERHFTFATQEQYAHLYLSEIRLLIRVLKQMIRLRRNGNLKRKKPDQPVKRRKRT